MFSVHSRPESTVVLTLVGDGLPDTASKSVFLVELLTDLFLACNDRCGEFLLVHLGNPLGLEVDCGESGSDGPVETISGDIVDILPAEFGRIFLGSGPGCVVDLRNDHSGSDLKAETFGNGVNRGSHDHVICRFVCHSSVFD